jgi:hypothetical protein
MSHTPGGAPLTLVADNGVTVTVTVEARPQPHQAPPPHADPPPARHVPVTQPPGHHVPHNPLAFTGLPATQLLVVAAVVVAIGLLLIRAGRHSSEVGNA